MRAFLLAFNDSLVPRQMMQNSLDKVPEILNWLAILQGGIFLTSDSSAQQLSQRIREQYPYLHFVVAELPRGFNDGFLPQVGWDFINDPKPSSLQSLLRQLLPPPAKK